MIINFRQGIVSYDTSTPPFTAAASVGGVDVSLNIGTQPFVVAVANQASNYLWSESLTVNAWPSLSPSGTYWLYFDFNTQTFARTFGTSTLAPINQGTAPGSPATGQHWFNTTIAQMYFWNGAAWNPVLRLFVAKFIGPSTFVSLSINSPSFQGTTVGNTTPNVSTGRVLVDSSGYPILKHDGTFFTTEDQSFAEGSAINGVRLESNVFTAQSASPSIIPVYEAVAFNQDGTVRIAGYNDAGPTAIALALQQINFSGTGAVLLEGTVTNPLWNWAGQIGSLLWVSGDIPGTLQNTDPFLDNPVTYPIQRVPVARVIGPTSIIFLQGIGTKGDPGPSGNASIPLATSIVAGIVYLSTDAGNLPLPSAIVVSELDPRLSNARTPLPHNQAASTIIVTPAGNITSTNAQAALQELDTKKLALAGGTMTGNLILNLDPTLPLQAATKEYVDAQVATVQTGLFNTTSGGLILTTDGSTRSVAANAKLYLQLPAGSGLTQDTTGLYIAPGSVDNNMLTNSSVTLVDDSSLSTLMTLGSRFDVLGTPNQIITSVGIDTLTIALSPIGTPGTYTTVTTDETGRVISGSAGGGGPFLPLAGGVMSGIIQMGSVVGNTFTFYNITDLADPINAQDAATKIYVDNTVSNALADYLPLAGGTMQGVIDMGGIVGNSFTRFAIIDLADPINPFDAATKNYVDTISSLPDLVIPYDLAFFIPGNMTTTFTITGGYLATRNITIPAGASGSLAKCGTAPAASTTYSLNRNGSSVGTIVFTSTVGIITIASNINLVAGDEFTIVTPGTVDASIANVFITLVGTAVA